MQLADETEPCGGCPRTACGIKSAKIQSFFLGKGLRPVWDFVPFMGFTKTPPLPIIFLGKGSGNPFF